MTSVKQFVRYARRLGQISESGTKVVNRFVKYASTQAQHKFIEDENGKKIFPSPFGDFTPSDSLVHEYVWKNVELFPNRIALVIYVTKIIFPFPNYSVCILFCEKYNAILYDTILCENYYYYWTLRFNIITTAKLKSILIYSMLPFFRNVRWPGKNTRTLKRETRVIISLEVWEIWVWRKVTWWP